MSDVVRSISDGAAERVVPLAAILELTRKCNLACRHCYATPEKGRPELSRDELCRVIDELRDLGTLFLTFLGGDPTVNRDFLAILQHAHERKLAIQMYSNGLRIDEATADELAKLRVFHIGLSLYGATAAVHDDITRRRGSHEGTLRAARLLRERGIPVVFKFIAMNRNAHEAWAADEMARTMGIPIRIDATITARDDLNRDTYALRTEREQRKRLLTEFQELSVNRVDRKGGGDLSCGMGKNFFSINAYGDVFPCVTLPIPAGNVRYCPLREIWEEAPLFREVRRYPRLDKLHGCTGCGLRSHCHRCPGHTFTETGDLYGPSPSACKDAMLWKEIDDERRGVFEEIPLPPGLDESHLPGWTASDLAEASGCGIASGLRSIADEAVFLGLPR